MLKNKFFVLLTLVCFISMIAAPALAQEEDSDYEHLGAGECVTQNGFFFTEKGMIKLVVNVQEKVKISSLEKQKEIDLIKIDLEKCIKNKEVELKIQKEMFEKQLLIKQQAIDAYKNEIFWDNIKIVGTAMVAIASGLLIGKFLIK